jgi:hypothetical protein
MADDVLKNAEALRDSLAQRLAALQAEVAATESDLQHAETMVERAKGNRPTVAVRAAVRNPSRQEVIDLVLGLLMDRGKPMQLRDLYEALLGEGVTLSGKDPTSVLGTMLWRGGKDGVLVNLPRYGYWPSDKPYQPAKYQPSGK